MAGGDEPGSTSRLADPKDAAGPGSAHPDVFRRDAVSMDCSPFAACFGTLSTAYTLRRTHASSHIADNSRHPRSRGVVGASASDRLASVGFNYLGSHGPLLHRPRAATLGRDSDDLPSPLTLPPVPHRKRRVDAGLNGQFSTELMHIVIHRVMRDYTQLYPQAALALSAGHKGTVQAACAGRHNSARHPEQLCPDASDFERSRSKEN